MTDIEDWWEPYDDAEPPEPDWGYEEWLRERATRGRERRRLARHRAYLERLHRKVQRHALDRFWRVRNPAAFDQEAPF